MNIAANFLIPSTPPSLPRKRTVTCCSSILIYNEDKVEDYIGNGTKELKEYFPTERVLPCNDGLRCKRDYNHFSPEEEDLLSARLRIYVERREQKTKFRRLQKMLLLLSLVRGTHKLHWNNRH